MIRLLSKFILKKYDIISFDIFDTLIERTVDKPTDIFCKAGKKIIGNNCESDYCRQRVNAERQARMKKANNEVTLEEIYSELTEYTTEQRKQLYKAEIEEELKSCIRKEKIFVVFEQALRHGKTIYLISDMYLPTTVIINMLSKCDIQGYNKLYVSNSYGTNKITGGLFKIALKENHISHRKMIHIGDSIKADFIGARKAGIRSYLIGRKKRLGRLFCRL